MLSVSSNNNDWLKECSELISQTGFCVVSDVIDDKNCILGVQALKDSYKKVVNLIGSERLERSGEKGVIRAPMSFNDYFFTFSHF